MTYIDYKEFAECLKAQAQELVPKEFSAENKQYLVDTLYNFTLMSGEALVNESLDENNTLTLTQIIAEWTFHKTCDLVRSQVPKKYWDNILQSIAFTIFEIGKKTTVENFDQKEFLEKIEKQVDKCYKKKLEELCANSAITKEIMEEALTHSNINELVEEKSKNTGTKLKFDSKANKEDCVENEKKQNFIKCHPWVLLFVILPLITFIIITISRFIDLKSSIVVYLRANTVPFSIGIIALTVIIGITYYFITIKKIKKYENELEDVSKKMKDLSNPDKMYERLGSDILCLSFGRGLISIVDSDFGGLLLPKTSAMRQQLTDTLGYVIPEIRIMESAALEDNEYVISIREAQVASGYVYPQKVMVKDYDWDAKHKDFPEDFIFGTSFDNEQCFWVNEADAKGLNYMLPEDVIIKHEENIYIQYVDKIMVNADVEKYLEIVKATNPKLVETLLSRLEIEDIRDVFVNLIRERVSIKDAPYIVERLSYHAREDQKPEYLSEQLRMDLALQVCSQNIDNDKVIYATKLSKDLIKTLSEVGFEEDGRSGSSLKFALNEEQKEDLIQEINTQIIKAQQITNKKVALLCPKHLRLAIYRMFCELIPDIVVLAEEEIPSVFKVEEI